VRTPTIFAFVIIAAAVIGGIVLLLATRPEPVHITINPPAPTAAPLPTATPAPIGVYVTGSVVQPGTVVTLPPGSRVEDAVQAAGGFTPDADLDRVNLAALLRDGDQVHVPRVGEIISPPVQSESTSTGQIVHINTATLEELETLPGIGEVRAQAIIDYRTANGPFTSMESLLEVSGIGEATIQQLEGLIVFD
jgi:competence protein ComEA